MKPKNEEEERNPPGMKHHAHRRWVPKQILLVASVKGEFRQIGLQGASSSMIPLELQVKNSEENTIR